MSAEAAAIETDDTPSVVLGGDGSPGSPLTADVQISATTGNLLTEQADGLAVTCEAVQDCVGSGMGDGLTYNDATNTFLAQLSADPGNAVQFGTDGGLFTPVGGGNPVATADTACLAFSGDGAGIPLSATPVIAPTPEQLLECTPTGLQASLTVGACGLGGDGSPGAPLTAKVAAWPYTCDADTQAGRVFCDSTGQLRSEPRGYCDFSQSHVVQQNFANIAVPAAQTTILADTLSVTNPDPCRSAWFLFEGEIDVDFGLPAAGGAAIAVMDGDDQNRLVNQGAAPTSPVHTQHSKVYERGVIAPGATLIATQNVQVRGGAGGATYSRAQSAMRAFLFIL